MRRTGEHYARLGITTAMDGASDVGALKMLHAAADDGSLPIDVVSYPLYQLERAPARRWPRPTGRATWAACGSAA